MQNSFSLQHLNSQNSTKISPSLDCHPAIDDYIKNLHNQILVPNFETYLQLKAAIAMELSARQKFIAQSPSKMTTSVWPSSSKIDESSRISPKNVNNLAKNDEKIAKNGERNAGNKEIEILEKEGKKLNKNSGKNKFDNESWELSLEEFAAIFSAEFDQNEQIKLGKWRQKYLLTMSNVFSQSRNQPRQMLSRKKYEVLVDRIKRIEQMEAAGNQLPIHFLKIRQKYRLVSIPSSKNGETKNATMLAERKGNRLFLCVDQLFDVLYKFHMDTRHGRSISMYTATRKKFANITVECILKFLEGCEDCKKWNKNEKKLNTLLTPNRNKEKKIRYGHFFDFDNQMISCRNCAYKRETKAEQKSTNALRSHLKKYHRELLRESRQSDHKINDEIGEEEEECCMDLGENRPIGGWHNKGIGGGNGWKCVQELGGAFDY